MGRRVDQFQVELLESRWLFADVAALASAALANVPFPNVDISRRVGNESEATVAIDRTDPNRVFVASNTNIGRFGIFVAYSTDAGATWTGRIIGDGEDGLPPACCDPSAAFDAFGNLYFCYINSDKRHVEVLTSTDGGQTLTVLTSFRGDLDQPTLATGPGSAGSPQSLWLTVDEGDGVVAAGAPISGLGQVGDFSDFVDIPGSGGGAFGDIAVGPDGQVAVTYQRGKSGKSSVGLNVDPDGLGPAKFGKRVIAANTKVGLFDDVPPQPARGIDAEAGLAYDRSAGPHRGRLYLVYTDATPRSRTNTDVFLRYSDNGGLTWSAAGRINDDVDQLAQQILPRVATDDTTGEVAVSWYDSRDDPQKSGAPEEQQVTAAASRPRTKAAEREEGDEDEEEGPRSPRASGGGSKAARDPNNDDAAFYVARVTPTAAGFVVSPNVRVSAGTANADDAENSIDLGDYTGLDYHNGVLFPVWSDNADATTQNPAGSNSDFDLYTARVTSAGLPTPSRTVAGGLGGGGGPAATIVTKGYTTVTKGSTFSFKVTYATPAGVDPTSLDGTELTAAGPGGFTGTIRLAKVKASRDRKTVTATYVLTNPSGKWRSVNNGLYTLVLTDGKVKDLLGAAAVGGELGGFVVVAK